MTVGFFNGGNTAQPPTDWPEPGWTDVEGRDDLVYEQDEERRIVRMLRSEAASIRTEHAQVDMPACRGCGRPFWPAPHREHKSNRTHGETHCRYCRNALLAAETRGRWSNVQDVN